MQILDDNLINLLQRYNRPGPRYTSYPAAPVFSVDYDAKRFEIDLIRNNHENHKPLSFYLHIPFCDSLCYFCGCTTIVTRNREPIRSYLINLKREIAKVAAYIPPRRTITQLHWGGGTPSYLTPAEIDELSTFISDRFALAADAEIGVEIDPRDLTLDHLKAFRSHGANRISVGVQDFSERVQKAVNRIQPESVTLQTLEWAKSLGVQSVNIDLIYGLPLQTLESFQRTLDRIVEISPNRIAVFNFAYVPWVKAHQKLLHPEDLPSPQLKLQLLRSTIETLTGAGYEYIGMDHFAKPDDELAVAQKEKRLQRNFQGYSTRAGADLYGFGMSAISHFGDVYAQNAKDLQQYTDAIQKGRFATAVGYKMSHDDQTRKFVIMRLMCDLEIDKNEVEELFGIVFDDYFETSLERLDEFIVEGLVRIGSDRIAVQPAGRLFLRNIAMCFDAYLDKFHAEKTIFSKTV